MILIKSAYNLESYSNFLMNLSKYLPKYVQNM